MLVKKLRSKDSKNNTSPYNQTFMGSAVDVRSSNNHARDQNMTGERAINTNRDQHLLLINERDQESSPLNYYKKSRLGLSKNQNY